MAQIGFKMAQKDYDEFTQAIGPVSLSGAVLLMIEYCMGAQDFWHNIGLKPPRD